MMGNILNMSSGRCWASEVYNPVPGVLENVPATSGYEGGFGTSLMAKVIFNLCFNASYTAIILSVSVLYVSNNDTIFQI